MITFFVILHRISNFLTYQPGELPVPRKSKENQVWGNYTFMEFLEENWFYLSAIIGLVCLLVFYNIQKKKSDKEEDR